MSDENYQQLTLFRGASPARTCPLPASARAWLESAADFGLSSIAFLRKLARHGLLSKTSPVCYPVTRGEILPLSFEGWSKSGIAAPGGYLTLNTSEWPSGAVVCSLSDILETGVPQKYFLSVRAAQGILRRAEKRGRELPLMLQQALETLVGMQTKDQDIQE